MKDKPKRIRVSGDGLKAGAASRRASSPPEVEVDEVESFYAQELLRSQLRLGLGVLGAFIAVIAAMSLALAALPALNEETLMGYPLAWLIQAFGFYPVICVFAIIYVRAASSNEKRYFALLGDQ
ncbi:heavy metal transporter [Pseudoclavibacter sp. RFBG4]|uniref:heavy metal transporter n=1 Tax=Pseudoclavibacter sp. RFBG4 TaxID=2080575 RepID=UPI000CE8B87A|nr:heavy metal transporter [Pseudoclavibacter sp. RFBG4]PPG26340.1 heavy metal transporter [Pseudoclavibacter sp. RFBG4]